MYGMHVHEAVKVANETETGITIHYVNSKFDDGEIIFQTNTPLTENDTPETIAQKIHALEMENFPVEIDKILN